MNPARGRLRNRWIAPAQISATLLAIASPVMCAAQDAPPQQQQPVQQPIQTITPQIEVEQVPLPANLSDMPQAMRLVYSYLLVIDEYSRVARDPAATGIAAVMGANDLLKAQGPEAAINFFSAALQRTQNESVRRVIRLQLIDLYKQTNQPDKALDDLRTLIIETPGD